LIQANLKWAKLEGANFQQAILIEANFDQADLTGAYLRQFVPIGISLQERDFWGVNSPEPNFQEANLAGAKLQGVDLGKANFGGASLFKANLDGAAFDSPDLPNLRPLAGAVNLEKITFHESPLALITLREAFKREGMREQERQITHAIERTRRLQAWDPSWDIPWARDGRPWPEKLRGKTESLFTYVLFELPSGYGLAPRRAVAGLLGLIPIFAFPYWIGVRNANSRSGIWMIVPADRIATGRGQEKVVRIRPHTARTWRQRLVSEYRMFRMSLYFSVLSAFHLGWREFNVGTWIARIQPREYTLRATGWVRTVSGIQSLLSVYLLALWVLTYFGRPFE
jgi:hypothetical protein